MAGGGDVDMAAVGRLLADRGRCRILLALADGRALPASVLASEAGVRASTASEHLRKLTERGLIEVIPTGRYRYYRLRGPDVARLVEVIGRLAPTQPVRSLREGTRAHALRLASRSSADDRRVAGPDGVHRVRRKRTDSRADRARQARDLRSAGIRRSRFPSWRESGGGRASPAVPARRPGRAR